MISSDSLLTCSNYSQALLVTVSGKGTPSVVYEYLDVYRHSLGLEGVLYGVDNASGLLDRRCLFRPATGRCVCDASGSQQNAQSKIFVLYRTPGNYTSINESFHARLKVYTLPHELTRTCCGFRCEISLFGNFRASAASTPKRESRSKMPQTKVHFAGKNKDVCVEISTT